MKNNLTFLFSFFLFSFHAFGQNAAHLDQKTWQPYNDSPTVSWKFFKTDSNLSLYVQCEAEHVYSISVRCYDEMKGKKILFDKTAKFRPKTSLETFSIPLETQQSQFIAELIVRDSASGKIFSDVIPVYDTKSENYKISIKTENGDWWLQHFMPQGSRFSFQTAASGGKLFIKYFSKGFQPAPPPFSERTPIFDYKKDYDTIFTIPAGKVLALPRQGLYFVQTDKDAEGGYFLNCTDEFYPELKKAEDLALAARYIAKNDEYQSLTTAETPKKNLDDFWLKISSDRSNAKDFIKKYYNQVQAANRFFTTYKEGWKTDRGMIFTIFGAPKEVRKTIDSEIWYYQNTHGSDDVQFIFELKNGQLVLQRDKFLKAPWSEGVYKWRRGK